MVANNKTDGNHGRFSAAALAATISLGILFAAPACVYAEPGSPVDSGPNAASPDKDAKKPDLPPKPLASDPKSGVIQPPDVDPRMAKAAPDVDPGMTRPPDSQSTPAAPKPAPAPDVQPR